MFILLPLEHSEKIENGKRMMEEVQKMIDTAPNEDIKKMNEKLLVFAKDHHNVLEKWGRYPSRNEALARKSTEEETEFLKEHKGW